MYCISIYWVSLDRMIEDRINSILETIIKEQSKIKIVQNKTQKEEIRV